MSVSSIIAITIVGYGDVSPETAAGKILAAMTALLGIAVIAIPVGILSSGITDSLKLEKINFDYRND